MLCFVPLATGQTIPLQVLKDLTKQTVGIDLIPCCTEGVLDSNKNISIEKLTGEISSRNLALDLIKKCGEKFVIMQDRDCLHIFENNYTIAVDYLNNNPKVGILSLPWKEYEVKNHIIMRAMVLRVEALKNFKFRYDERRHLCPCMMEDMVREEWECKFLPSDKRLIKELPR